jgi:hypothetical protein
MAHDIEANDLERRVADLAQFMVQSVGLPLPEPKSAPNSESTMRFHLIDLALAGLYSGLRGHFEVANAFANSRINEEA